MGDNRLPTPNPEIPSSILAFVRSAHVLPQSTTRETTTTTALLSTLNAKSHDEIVKERAEEFDRQRKLMMENKIPISDFLRADDDEVIDDSVGKARKSLLVAWRIWNSFPTFASEVHLCHLCFEKQITRRSGASDEFAETVYVAGTTVDTFTVFPFYFCA